MTLTCTPADLAALLQQGSAAIFPTDTLPALACKPEAAELLWELKQRPRHKPVILMAASAEQLLECLGRPIEAAWQQMAERYWPGALTLVVPRHPDLPANLSPLPTVGVRMPNHAFTLELLRRAGPLATSSANLSGETNTLTAQQVWEQLAGRVELILDGGPVPGGVPSTVVDCTQDSLRILRQGAISEEVITRLLRA